MDGCTGASDQGCITRYQATYVEIEFGSAEVHTPGVPNAYDDSSERRKGTVLGPTVLLLVAREK